MTRKPMSPENRAKASARMARLNERMRTDPALKKKAVEGATAARREPSYRQIQALVMKDTMSRPENRAKAREHCCQINREPQVRSKQWAGRVRNGSLPVPPRPRRDADALILRRLKREASKGAPA